MSSQIRIERRTQADRRVVEYSPAFPFFDCEQTLVREDRRRTPDRRINNIEIQTNDKNDISLTRLFLWYKDDVCELLPGSPEIVVGRSPSCDLQFQNRYTSRTHAKFEYIDDEFIVTDQSTNGTYIKNEDGEMFIMGEKMSLHGSGIISLGNPIEYVDKDVIHYFCP